jgi:hypothetical protein
MSMWGTRREEGGVQFARNTLLFAFGENEPTFDGIVTVGAFDFAGRRSRISTRVIHYRSK